MRLERWLVVIVESRHELDTVSVCFFCGQTQTRRLHQHVGDPGVDFQLNHDEPKLDRVQVSKEHSNPRHILGQIPEDG